MTNRSIILGAALAAALSAGPVSAGERTERIPYRDLDLTSPQGQTELQERIDSAARRVCRFAADGQLVTPAEESACYREARRKVEVQVAQITSDLQRGG